MLIASTRAHAQHFYYAPNSVHIPALSEKGSGSVGVGLGWGQTYTAIEVQAAYSPRKHAAIMINYLKSGARDVKRDIKEGAHFAFAEIGLGAYQKLERGAAIIFAGVGQGQLHNYYGSANFSNFKIRRWFLQPTLVYRDRSFQGGVALRISRLVYADGQSSFDISNDDLDAIKKIEKNAPFFMPEMGLSGSIRLSPLVLTVNLTSVFPDMDEMKFTRFNTNLTLSFDVGEVARKRKEKQADKK